MEKKYTFFCLNPYQKSQERVAKDRCPPPYVNLRPLGLVYICMQIIREESTAVEPANISLSGIPIKKIY